MAATKTKQVSGWKLLWRLMRYQPKLYVIDSIFWILIMGLPAVPGLIIREFSTPSRANLNSASLPGPSLPLLANGLGQIVVIFAGRLTKVSCALPSVH